MASTRLKVAAAVSTSYVGLFVVIVLLVAGDTITPQMALLMLIALTGLYLGFGLLVALYRFVSTLK